MSMEISNNYNINQAAYTENSKKADSNADVNGSKEAAKSSKKADETAKITENKRSQNDKVAFGCVSSAV